MIINHLKEAPSTGYLYAAGALFKVKWPRLPFGDTQKGMRSFVDSIELILKKMNPDEVPGTDTIRNVFAEEMSKSVVLKTEMDHYHRCRTNPLAQTPGEVSRVVTEQYLRNVIDAFCIRQDEIENKAANEKALNDMAEGRIQEVYGTVGRKSGNNRDGGRDNKDNKNRRAAPAADGDGNDGKATRTPKKTPKKPKQDNTKEPEPTPPEPPKPEGSTARRARTPSKKAMANPNDPRSKIPCVFHQKAPEGCTLGINCPYEHGDKMKKAEVDKMQFPSKRGRPRDESRGSSKDRNSRSPAPPRRGNTPRTDSEKKGGSGRSDKSPGRRSSSQGSGKGSGKGKGKGKGKDAKKSKFHACPDYFKDKKCNRSVFGNGSIKCCSKGLHCTDKELKALRAANDCLAAKDRDHDKAKANLAAVEAANP